MAKARASSSTKDSKALARREEIAELGTRKGAKKGSLVQVRTVLGELRPALREHDEEDGRRVHRFGTRIRWFYGVLADELLGRATFLEFVRIDLGITEATARRAVRVATYATATQAAWGTSIALDVASIVDLLAADPALRKAWNVREAPRLISDLKGVAFVLDDDRTVRFDAGRPDPVAVSDLLELLRENAAPRTGKLSRADRETDEKLRAACRTDPDLEGVDARLRRTRKGPRMIFSVPPGANLDRVTKAILKALA